MKRILFASVMLASFGAAAQVTKADVSVDFFYNNLSGGNWIEVGDYGYCWQPDVAVNDTGWRPYADGYWAYTDEGWTWISYEDFGWATYHYGRWAHLTDLGWVWVPGRDEDLQWGPAWVSWRTGDEYVGWAPLPPAGEPVYEGRTITGDVDIEFDIGPAYYNFCEVRYIGEPVLRERLIAPTLNLTYINQTVNVTNITYKNKIVYNYGPDINVMNQRAARRIQRLTIRRENSVDFATTGRSGGLQSKVQGQSLVVAAPAHIARSTRRLAPPTVKTRVAKANLDTGWSGVGDANAKENYKQKLRSEDRRRMSGGAAGVKAGTQTTTSPMPGPAASVGAGDQPELGNGEKHKRKWQGEGARPTAAGMTPQEASVPQGLIRGQPSAVGTPRNFQDAGQGERGTRRLKIGPIPPGAATPSDFQAGPGAHGGRHHDRSQEQGVSGQQGNAAGGSQPVQPDQPNQGRREGGRKNRGEMSPGPSPQ